MTSWQPIETAPRDGTLILGWDNDFKECVIAHWGIVHQWNDPNDVYDWIETHNPFGVTLTHWMPIPNPPTL